MVDPLAAEQVEARGDVHRRGVLGGMAGEAQPARLGGAERVDELLGRVGGLRRVHPEADDLGAQDLQQLGDHLQAVRGVVLAVHVGDEAALHAEVDLGGVDALGEAVDDGLHGHAAVPVCNVGLKNISR